MNKTKIEWTDYTWNPIKGLCPVGCWYCYARKIYKRFDLMGQYFVENDFTCEREYKTEKDVFLYYPELRTPHDIKKPSKIFLCSTIELFHEEISPVWRDHIFNVIRANPQHTFQILTKLPQNIDRPMPDNVWLGVTVEDSFRIERTYELIKKKARVKFVSFEPFLGMITYDELDHLQLFQWIIVGRLTGHGKDYDPARWWVAEIEDVAKKYKIPLFLKDNLREIWGESLIQEFPKIEDE